MTYGLFKISKLSWRWTSSDLKLEAPSTDTGPLQLTAGPESIYQYTSPPDQVAERKSPEVEDLHIETALALPTPDRNAITERMLQHARERVGTDPQRTRGLLYTNVTPSERGLCASCAAIDWRAALIRNKKPFNAQTERSESVQSPVDTRTSGHRWEEFELGNLKLSNHSLCTLCDLITRGLEEVISPEPLDTERIEGMILTCRCENPWTKPAPWPEKSLEYTETFGRLRLKIRLNEFYNDYYGHYQVTSFPELEFSIVDDVSRLLGDPYSELMIRRLAKPSINGTQIEMNTLRLWTQQCRLEHPECRSGWHGPMQNSAPKRTYTLRLIDSTTMRVVIAQAHARYAALSYVWGGAEQYSSRKQDVVIQTEGDLDSEYVSLEDRKLPKTVSDAIQVCKEIRVRYLWVDTLCIIQDDAVEKNQSLSAMDQIYRSAMLTIIAASSTHADAGLAGVQPGSRNLKACEGWLDGLRLRRVNKYDAEATIEDKPWSKRGWTYQESYFSPRKLIFANDRAYYHCSESSYGEISPLNKGCFRKPIFPSHSSSAKDLQTMRSLPSGPFHEYAMHAENYNWRTLSYQTDILRAFAGVASDLERATDKRMRLFDGLPVGFLHRALCWETKNPQRKQHSTRRCSGPDDRPFLPTWTWAAWSRAVHYTRQYYFVREEGETSDESTNDYMYSFSFPWREGAEYQLAQDSSDRRIEDSDPWVADVLRTGILTFVADIGEWDKQDLIPVPHTLDDGTVWENGKKYVLSIAQVYRAKTKFGGNPEHLHFVLFLREELNTYYREGGAWISHGYWDKIKKAKKTVFLG